MHCSTISISSQAVWEGLGDEGESPELVLDYCLLDYGCHWDCVGISSKADEGAYGWHCVALLLAKTVTPKHKHYHYKDTAVKCG